MRASTAFRELLFQRQRHFTELMWIQHNEFHRGSVCSPCRGHGWLKGRECWVDRVLGSRNASISLSTNRYWAPTTKLLTSWNLGLGFSFRKCLPIVLFCPRSIISLEWGLCLSSAKLSRNHILSLEFKSHYWSDSLLLNACTCLSFPYWPVAWTSDTVYCPLCLGVPFYKLQIITVSNTAKWD